MPTSQDDIERQVQKQAAFDARISERIAAKSRKRRRRRFLLFTLFGILTLWAAIAFMGLNPDPTMDSTRYYKKASRFQKAGNISGEFEALKQTLIADPQHMDARWPIAQLYLIKGNGVDADKEILMARTLGLPVALSADLFLRAKLAQREYFEVLVDIVLGLEEEKTPEALVFLGEAQMGLYQIERAEIAFEQALDLDQTHWPARLGLARVHLADDDLSEAMRQGDLVLDEMPDNIDALVMKGWVTVIEGQIELAKLAFETVLLKNKNFPEANLGLARVLITQGNLTDAGKYIATASQINRHESVIEFYEIVLMLKKGQFEEARNTLNVALRSPPDNPDVLLLLALLHYDQQRDEQSLLYAKHLLGLSASDVNARKLLGRLYNDLGNYETAIVSLLPAEPLIPYDIELNADLARAFHASGFVDKASEYVEKLEKAKALEMEPTADVVRLDSVGFTDIGWPVTQCRILIRVCDNCLFDRLCQSPTPAN